MFLKIFAFLVMFIDHFAHFSQNVLPHETYMLLRFIGRLAFPCFAYLLVIGYKRCRCVFRYTGRMLGFAVLTQLSFFITEKILRISLWMNVLISFTLGLMLIFSLELILYAFPDGEGRLKAAALGAGASGIKSETEELPFRISLYGMTFSRKNALITAVMLIFCILVLTRLLEPDYGFYGLATIVIFYLGDSGNPRSLKASDPEYDPSGGEKPVLPYIRIGLAFLFLNLINSLIYLSDGVNFDQAFLQSASVLAVPLFPSAFTGKKPGYLMKYMFYLLYPAHIILLAFLLKSA